MPKICNWSPTARGPGDAGGRDTRRDADVASCTAVLNLLTPEERLVSIWRKAGFSSAEMARHLQCTVSAIDNLHRSGITKAGRMKRRLRLDDKTGEPISLNCPLCGVKLSYRGRAADHAAYACDVHGEYWLDKNGNFGRVSGEFRRHGEGDAS